MSVHGLAQRLGEAFATAHADDAARLLEQQSAASSAATLAACDAPVAATLLGAMSPTEAALCLAEMTAQTLDPIFAALTVAKAANLLRRLDTAQRDAVLDRLSADRRVPIEQLLRYPDGSVGAAMDPAAFALPADLDVETATHRIRQHAKQIQYYIYIVDREQRLCGVLNVRDFLLAEPQQRISEIMQTEVTRLRPETPVAKLQPLDDGARFLSLPVVDEDGTLLGVLSGDAYHRAPRGPASDRQPWDTLYAFSELYWVGLSGMLSGATTPASRSEAVKGAADAE